jgi:hypothetical protein
LVDPLGLAMLTWARDGYPVLDPREAYGCKLRHLWVRIENMDRDSFFAMVSYDDIAGWPDDEYYDEADLPNVADGYDVDWQNFELDCIWWLLFARNSVVFR